MSLTSGFFEFRDIGASAFVNNFSLILHDFVYHYVLFVYFVEFFPSKTMGAGSPNGKYRVLQHT